MFFAMPLRKKLRGTSRRAADSVVGSFGRYKDVTGQLLTAFIAELLQLGIGVQVVADAISRAEMRDYRDDPFTPSKKVFDRIAPVFVGELLDAIEDQANVEDDE